MDKELFELAVEAAMKIPPKDVIGTKAEYRVHGALKYYFQPCDDYHEVKLEGFICDATDADSIAVYEVQTSGFDRLRKKLQVLLTSHPVTVIYPVIVQKTLSVIYSGSGETIIRKSPKKAKLTNILAELCKIKELLPHPNLHIKAVLLNATETRIYKGLREDKKRRQKPFSVERVPTDLLEITNITFPDFYLSLLPDTLPNEFSSTDLAKLLSVKRSVAGYALLLLTDMKFVTRIGRNKHGYIYIKSHP